MYSIGHNPSFWFGGISDSKGKKERYYQFKDFFSTIIQPTKKNQRNVFVVKDVDRAFSYLQYHARTQLNFKINPRKKGCKNAMYKAMHVEIYGKDTNNPIILLGLNQYEEQTTYDDMAKTLDMTYERPRVADEFEYLTPKDDEQLYNSLELLRRYFLENKYDQEFRKGNLTTSSISNHAFKSHCRAILGKPYNTSFKPKFKQSDSKKEPIIPLALKGELEKQTELFKERNSMFNHETDKYIYTVNQNTLKTYRQKLLRYWLKRYDEEDKYFRDYMKTINVIYEIEGHTDEVYDFLALPLPSGESPQYDALADEYHMFRIMDSVNKKIRPSLRGGYNYLNPITSSTIVGGEYGGITLDINSIYAYIMQTYELPSIYCGSSNDLEPNREKYYVAIVRRLKATCKPDKMPFLRRDNKLIGAIDGTYKRELDWHNEYVDGNATTVLNNVEIDWLYENYDVHEIDYEKVFYFKADEVFTQGLRKHISELQYLKENAKNPIERKRAKNQLNRLWGRFAMYEKEVQHGAFTIDIGQKDVNLVTGAYITSLARITLNKMINKLGGMVQYTNTDSVHIEFNEWCRNEEELTEMIGADTIDPNVFGKWKIEHRWKRAIFHRSGCYALELHDGTIKTVVNGMRVKVDKLEQFYEGKKIPHVEYKRDDEGRYVAIQRINTL